MIKELALKRQKIIEEIEKEEYEKKKDLAQLEKEIREKSIVIAD